MFHVGSSVEASENSAEPIKTQHCFQWARTKKNGHKQLKLKTKKRQNRKLSTEASLLPDITSGIERTTKLQAHITMSNITKASLQHNHFEASVVATLHDPEANKTIGGPGTAQGFFADSKNSITLQADLAKQEDIDSCTSKKLEVHVEVTVTESKRKPPAQYQCTEEEEYLHIQHYTEQ